MKKLFALAMTMLLGASLSFAQATSGSGDANKKADTTTSGKKTTKTSKAHKGGKKSKKGSKDTGTTTPPK